MEQKKGIFTMMTRYLNTCGLICVLCATAAYAFVGAANPLYETTTNDQFWSATAFIVPALILFYLAWRTHVLERLEIAEDIILDVHMSPQTQEDGVSTWLEQWKK